MSKLGKLKIVEAQAAKDEASQASGRGQAIARAVSQVRRTLGAGLAPSVYREALAIELRSAGLAVQEDVPFAVRYRDQDITAFAADLLVDGEIMVFIRAEPRSEEQKTFLATCLKHTGYEEAFLVNFQIKDMRQGIMRAAVQKGSIPLQVNSKSVN